MQIIILSILRQMSMPCQSQVPLAEARFFWKPIEASSRQPAMTTGSVSN
jgi:hypothetical protein